MKEYVNNHFIEKWRVKLFCNDNKYFYIINDQLSFIGGMADINQKGIVSKDFFYTKQLEKRMNILESQASNIICKIINKEDEIIISRYEK